MADAPADFGATGKGLGKSSGRDTHLAGEQFRSAIKPACRPAYGDFSTHASFAILMPFRLRINEAM